MSLISRTAQYALRSMSLLAAHKDERLTVRQLALAVGAPQPYLSRIIMAMADVGLVDARRGPGGGLKLGRDPSTVTLIDIITCFDGHTLFTDCCLGLPGCGESKHKCPVHDQWGAVRQQIKEWWTKTSLADFSAQDTSDCLIERVPSLNGSGTVKTPRMRSRWR